MLARSLAHYPPLAHHSRSHSSLPSRRRVLRASSASDGWSLCHDEQPGGYGDPPWPRSLAWAAPWVDHWGMLATCHRIQQPKIENLRNAFSEGLGLRNTGSTRGVDNHLDLSSIISLVLSSLSSKHNSYLHRAPVNQKSVQLSGGLGSGVRLAEDDRRNTLAGAILVVSEHDLLDWAG